MAKYRVVRSHCLGGGIDVYEGDELELSEKEALSKVRNGWLEPIPDEPPAAAEPSGSGPDEHAKPDDTGSTSDSEASTEPAREAGRRRR